jgi:hypothetical protein
MRTQPEIPGALTEQNPPLITIAGWQISDFEAGAAITLR